MLGPGLLVVGEFGVTGAGVVGPLFGVGIAAGGVATGIGAVPEVESGVSASGTAAAGGAGGVSAGGGGKVTCKTSNNGFNCSNSSLVLVEPLMVIISLATLTSVIKSSPLAINRFLAISSATRVLIQLLMVVFRSSGSRV